MGRKQKSTVIKLAILLFLFRTATGWIRVDGQWILLLQNRSSTIFLLLHGLTSNPGHDTSVLLVQIHGLQCSRITRHSKYIIHESRPYFISFLIHALFRNGPLFFWREGRGEMRNYILQTFFKNIYVSAQAAQAHYMWVRASEVIWSEYTRIISVSSDAK